MQYIKILFADSYVPLVPLFAGLFFVYVTSKHSFIKNAEVRAIILRYSPIIVMIIGFKMGASTYRYICGLFSFYIGISFAGLLSFYNLRIKDIGSKVFGILFLCIYLYLIFLALPID